MSVSLPHKKRKRTARTRAPKNQSLEEYRQDTLTNSNTDHHFSYGVITQYHGSGGRCTVELLLDQGTERIVAKLKGSYQKCSRLGMKLTKDTIVLVDDGVIVMVYRPEQCHAIDRATLRRLEAIMDQSKGKDVQRIVHYEPPSQDDPYDLSPSFDSDDEDRNDDDEDDQVAFEEPEPVPDQAPASAPTVPSIPIDIDNI
jgi:hypothetical protein